MEINWSLIWGYLRQVFPWIITTILSYFTWRANKSSADIAKQMSIQERNRDKENIIEKANKIYFSMINIFEYLISHAKNQQSKKDVYISEDWISDLAKMSVVFTEEEAKRVYDLFRNILVVKKTKKYEDIISVCNWVMIYDLLDLSVNNSIASNLCYEDVIDNNWRVILTKVKSLCRIETLDNIDEIKKLVKVKNIKKDYSENQIGYEIQYGNEKIEKIKIWNFSGDLMENVEFNESGFDGYKEIYCKDKIIQKGMFKDGNLINGFLYHIKKDDNYSEQYEDNNEIEEEEHSNYWERYYKVLEVKNGTILEDDDVNNYQYEFIDL